MDLLLDTHPFIWFLNGDEQLPPTLKVSLPTQQTGVF